MTLYALILAGGRGSRLGTVRKGEIRIGGTRLLDRVTAKLAEANLLVSTGPDDYIGTTRGVRIADEGADFAGPMAGIRAAVSYLRPQAQPEDLLVTVAVDTPFLPVDFTPRLIAALDAGANAAFASWGEGFYPTNAIYRISALFAHLAEHNPDSPKRLLQGLGALAVDWNALAPQNPFANLNTLVDLIALGRRAMAEGK